MGSHNFTDNGTSPSLASGAGRQRKRRVAAYGTFGGGTLTLEVGVNGTDTWVAQGGVSMTAAGVAEITVFEQDHVRVKLVGATTPDLTVTIDE